MKRVKVFLTSSNELKQERQELEIAIQRLNNSLINQNLFLDVRVWEEGDFLEITDMQDRLRAEILRSEIFVFLFYSKIGKNTKKEFLNALDRFKSGGNPQYIYTYFKDAPTLSIKNIGKNEIELLEFKESLHELGHFYSLFRDSSSLKEHFTDQIEKILISESPRKDAVKENIFISYSHKNTNWLEETLLYLKPLQKKEIIKVWSDKEIKIGSKWKESIVEALENAKIGLLLVTQEFLASDFIVDEEIPKLIDTSEKNGTIILPVICEPCTIEFEEELKKFQFFNSPQSPLSSLSDNERKAKFVTLTRAIVELYKKAPNKA